jgi:hypothetical protein
LANNDDLADGGRPTPKRGFRGKQAKPLIANLKNPVQDWRSFLAMTI